MVYRGSYHGPTRDLLAWTTVSFDPRPDGISTVPEAWVAMSYHESWPRCFGFVQYEEDFGVVGQEHGGHFGKETAKEVEEDHGGEPPDFARLEGIQSVTGDGVARVRVGYAGAIQGCV